MWPLCCRSWLGSSGEFWHDTDMCDHQWNRLGIVSSFKWNHHAITVCLYFHLLSGLNLQCLYKDVHLAWSAKASGGALALSKGLTSEIFAVLGRSKHGRSEPWACSSLPSESCMIHQHLFRPLQCNLKSWCFLLNRPLLWWKCRSGRLKPSGWMIHLGWCHNAAHLLSAAAFALVSVPEHLFPV